MNKWFNKKIMLSMMIVGIVANNIVPLHLYAEQQSKIHSSVQKSNKSNSLGPAGFKGVMEKKTTNVLVLDSYAKTILNQQEADLSKISSINSNLQESMIKHQKDAKVNASFWLNEMKPQILKTDQNIVEFNETFQSYYSSLIAAVDQKDKEKMKSDLEKLYSSILSNKSEADKLLETLKAFRSSMATDTKSFKDDSNQLTAILASTDAEIPLLQQQMNTYNASIKKNKDVVIAGAVLCAGVITCLAGGPMIIVAKKNIKKAERNIKELKMRISGAQAEIINLTDVKNKTVNMMETIDVAINSLQNMSNEWHTIGAKYNNVLQNVKNISPEELTFIKEDLKTAKDSWQDIKDYADKLSGVAIE